MKTTDFWQGSFGDQYIERNRLDYKPRLAFWESAIQFCAPTSVFEFGCNIGLNLLAIQKCAPSIDLFGVDVNAKAVEESRQAGFEVQQVGEQGIAGLYEPGSMDLVFTCGVLIHVAPADLERTMRSLIDLSNRYVLAVEYESDQEESIDYRGHAGKLWKRPFGKLYEAMGLKLLSLGIAGGFDNCQYALLEKAR